MTEFQEGNFFDPTRYQGRWYEIGKYPSIYEIECTGAIADYIFDPQRKGIEVTNTCLVNDKPLKQNHGFAAVTDTPGHLLLQFEQGGPASIYKVLETDYEKYAFVGDLSQGYFYILTRKPQTTPEELQYFRNKTITFGFDPAKVEINPNAISNILKSDNELE